MLAFVAVAASINAQVRPGIKAGYNLGGVMANYLGTETPENLKKIAGDPNNFHLKSGFQGGMIADCPISNAFAIQPGVRFALQGFKDKYTSNGDVIRGFSLYYLQVPVYAQYRLNIAEETNLLFQAGPYASFSLFGRQSYNRKGKDEKLDDKYKKITFGENKDIQKAFDYGVSAGVGFEFYRFQLVAAYDFGLTQPILMMDSQRTKSGSYHVDMRNHNFSLTLAVIFGRRDPLQHQRD
jgi:hypothetical protein